MIFIKQSAEPERSIFRARWQDAADRLPHLEPRQQDLFSKLLCHVEAGWWAGVRGLQLLYESHASLTVHPGRTADVLAFIDADVVDLYRVVAADAADLVPGWDGWPDAADPGDLDGDANSFDRYVGVLRSAAQSPELDRTVAGGIELACEGLDGWYMELGEILRIIDEEVIRPILPPDDD